MALIILISFTESLAADIRPIDPQWKVGEVIWDAEDGITEFLEVVRGDLIH